MCIRDSTRAIFTEREKGVMTLRRGFKIEPGTRVLIVEDIVTTGGSVQEVVNVVNQSGGEIVGVGLLVNRSGGKAEFGVPHEKVQALLNLEVPTYKPEAVSYTHLDVYKRQVFDTYDSIH